MDTNAEVGERAAPTVLALQAKSNLLKAAPRADGSDKLSMIRKLYPKALISHTFCSAPGVQEWSALTQRVIVATSCTPPGIWQPCLYAQLYRFHEAGVTPGQRGHTESSGTQSCLALPKKCNLKPLGCVGTPRPDFTRFD